MARKPKPKAKRPRGAQSDNKNALKHGFYSKGFTAEEKKSLDNSETDVLSEIKLIRVMLARLEGQISFDEITRTDNNGTEFRDAHYLSQLNTLTTMTGAIATLVRTHYLTTGKGNDALTSIQEALEELRLEMGI